MVVRLESPVVVDVLERYFKREPASAKLGVFCAALNNYWPQFPGLRKHLLDCHKRFCVKLRDLGLEVIDAGMSDSSQRAFEIGDELRRADVDLLICNMVTYTTSANVLPVAQRAGRPVVLAGLQPEAALDYANATTFMQLVNDNVTSLPEVCNALRRANLDIADAIVGQLEGDARADQRLADWGRVARCLNALRNGRIGLMGHVYEGMLDMNSDPTMADGKFGLHVEHIEMDDLQQRVDQVAEAQTDERVGLIRHLFHFPPVGSDPLAGEVNPAELRWAARVSIGMERLIDDFALSGLAYYYRGLDGNAHERLGCGMILGASLLTGRGIPIAGELDLKNCLAMLIMDRLGAGGSFAELHPVDFNGDFVLVGHDGPHHIAIAQGKPVLRGLSVLHGKRGRGPSVEFAIKNGPITLLGLTQTADGRYQFVVAEGESLPGVIPATGNTNTRGRFPPDVRTFIERWSLQGPTHHFALGIGHQAGVIGQLAKVLNIECVNVTA
ncbi:MAG: L-arabinose isomerase family protein [Phycisphaerales bacterium]